MLYGITPFGVSLSICIYLLFSFISLSSSFVNKGLSGYNSLNNSTATDKYCFIISKWSAPKFAVGDPQASSYLNCFISTKLGTNTQQNAKILLPKKLLP